MSITTDDARAMGATGAQDTEQERALFEAWMAGHCWGLGCAWVDGKGYVHEWETRTIARRVHPDAMRTRMLWAAWRDRAALSRLEQPLSQTVKND
jgi:hypothetical protein